MLIFLKEKRARTTKGRACADGSKKRTNIKKEEATSPTVELDSLFITEVTDAHEGRYVAVYNILGAYLSTDMGK